MKNNQYTLVTWPESQQFMKEWWFDSGAILDESCMFGSQAYFIPSYRLYDIEERTTFTDQEVAKLLADIFKAVKNKDMKDFILNKADKLNLLQMVKNELK